MTTTTPLQRAAAEAYSYFTKSVRSDGNTEYWHTKDGSPEWLSDLCHAAHDNGNIGPDDWRYKFIVEALEALEESDNPDEIYLEPDIYTGDLCAWLGSNINRPGYCDEAMEETGEVCSDIVHVLQVGQQREKEETLSTVRQWLEDNRCRACEEETPCMSPLDDHPWDCKCHACQQQNDADSE